MNVSHPFPPYEPASTTGVSSIEVYVSTKKQSSALLLCGCINYLALISIVMNFRLYCRIIVQLT